MGMYSGKCNFALHSACGQSCDVEGIRNRCNSGYRCAQGKCGKGLEWGCKTTKAGYSAAHCVSGQTLNGTCFWPRGSGDNCKYSYDCASGNCVGGVCVGIPVGGTCKGGAYSMNPCDVDAYCKTNQVHGTGVCTTKIDAGQPCTALDGYNDACRAGACDTDLVSAGVCRNYFSTADGEDCIASWTLDGVQRINSNSTLFCKPGSACTAATGGRYTCQRYKGQACDSRANACPVGMSCSGCDGTKSICQGTQAPVPTAECNAAIKKMTQKMVIAGIGSLPFYAGFAYNDKTTTIGKFLANEFAAFVCACGGPSIVPGDASMIQCDGAKPSMTAYAATCDFGACPTLAGAESLRVSSVVGVLCAGLLAFFTAWTRW